MKLDKERFLRTELGSGLEECIKAWDKWLEIKDEKAAYWCQAQWEVYQMAVRQFYGIEYHFTRTDEYFGVCTGDETDWLFKVERQWDEALTYEEFISLAKENYHKGGAVPVDCWGLQQFETYAELCGPITRIKALQMFSHWKNIKGL